MKHQALFSKDNSKQYKSVFCCNFAWLFKSSGKQVRFQGKLLINFIFTAQSYIQEVFDDNCGIIFLISHLNHMLCKVYG